MHLILQDIRQGIRHLARSPGFTIVAVVTLALGLGLNTAMFSLVNSLLFQSGPYSRPEQLVEIRSVSQQGDARLFSEPEIREIRPAVADSFESLAIVSKGAAVLSEAGQPAERIGAVAASSEIFDVFGMQPVIGRGFTEEETRGGNSRVVMLSHAFWKQRLGADPGIVGRSMRIDGEGVTVIGVMPPSFDYRVLWDSADILRPLVFTKDQLTYRDYRAFELMGRLKSGVDATRAEFDLVRVSTAQVSQFPNSYAGHRLDVSTLSEALSADRSSRVYWMLLGLSAFVLLIACANLANLQLVRATASLHDLAIRAALGASRARLVAQQIVECIILALAGGGLGLLLAHLLNQWIEPYIVFGGSPGPEITIEFSVILLTLGVSLGAGILFGIFPAWAASRADVSQTLKQQARGSTAGGMRQRARDLLIVAQVAMALMLLGGAAIMQRGFASMLERDFGWDSSRLLVANLPIPEAQERFNTYPKRVAFFLKLEQELKTIPGVEHAALATSLPITGYSADRPLLLQGQSEAEAENLPTGSHIMITSDYFQTMGIPLLEGRAFTTAIQQRGPGLVIVNQALAKRMWPGESAVGKRLGSLDSGEAYWYEVIGVVADVDTAMGDPSTPFHVYKPLVQEAWSWTHLVVRSNAPASLPEALRRAVAKVDPDLPADQVGTVREIVDQSQQNLVLVGRILIGFALLGMLLATIGLYGVISGVVAQRTGEFGVRLALGAQPGDLLMLVMGRGLRITIVGLVLGIVGAVALGRVLASMMPNIAGIDVIAIAGVSMVLLMAAMLACFVPARRATKVDPMVALRTE